MKRVSTPSSSVAFRIANALANSGFDTLSFTLSIGLDSLVPEETVREGFEPSGLAQVLVQVTYFERYFPREPALNAPDLHLPLEAPLVVANSLTIESSRNGKLREF